MEVWGASAHGMNCGGQWKPTLASTVVAAMPLTLTWHNKFSVSFENPFNFFHLDVHLCNLILVDDDDDQDEATNEHAPAILRLMWELR